mmetsp:Transcript_28904/g.85438  ORF Transcript_28904/g.85438 Transcript_28904/m.85438 type:complete len:90 (-) Transcript_28904:221-490(-)
MGTRTRLRDANGKAAAAPTEVAPPPPEPSATRNRATMSIRVIAIAGRGGELGRSGRGPSDGADCIGGGGAEGAVRPLGESEEGTGEGWS